MYFSLLPTGIASALDAPLVVIIPVYNEAENIGQVITEWSTAITREGVDFQILLINDGSKDDTLKVLQEMEISETRRLIIVDKPNSGHGRTCRLGYDAAVRSPNVKWVLQIDSDGQCDPSYFSQFWYGTEEADCVFGLRTKRDDGFARCLTSKICKMAATALSGKNMVDPNVPYRLIKKDVLASALKCIPASFDIHNVAITYVLKRRADLRWKYIPIRFKDRQGGSNSINLLNVAHLGISMLFDLAKLK